MESLKSQFQKKAGKEKRKQNNEWTNRTKMVDLNLTISTITLNIKV